MWDWMQTEGGKVFEGESFKAEIIAVFLVCCETLPEIGGGAYWEAVEAGKAEGMDGAQAMTAAALYFAVNHGLSPTGDSLGIGEAYLPLKPFMEDAAAWHNTHADFSPVEAMRLYADWALREKPVAVAEIEKPENGLKSLDLQLFAEDAAGGAVREIEITQLLPTDSVTYPTAKTFWKQPEIAAEGIKGVSVDVGGGAFVSASIYGRDGAKINLSAVQLHLQSVIGQMIMENGKPITVTPAQLYRAFAGLPASADVTEEQEACMVEAMDSLLFTEGFLDISMQLAKHKKMKRRPDVDYEAFCNRRSNLIVGVKETSKSVTYNGRLIRTAYTIYDYPLFFHYSYAISQLATVDRSVLLGGSTEKSLPEGHPDRTHLQRRERNVVLRRYLMAQVERIKSDKEKGRALAIRKKQTPPVTHTERLTFETIAASCDVLLTEKLRRQLRNDVKLILLDFKHMKYIKDAVLYNEGRAIKGVEITV